MKLFVYDKTCGKLLRYNENFQREEVGLVGKSYSTGKRLSVYNCYQHPDFNCISDIDTKMPTIKLPLREPAKHRVIGVNPKELENFINNHQPSLL